MASPTPGTFVLFLASDPALANRLASQPTPMGPLQRIVTGPVLRARPAAGPSMGASSGSPAWPADQVMCAQRVLDVARKAGRTVRLVDVNRPGDDRPLVERYVGEADLLPLLVRSDGARLEGVEAFAPSIVRAFLAHP